MCTHSLHTVTGTSDLISIMTHYIQDCRERNIQTVFPLWIRMLNIFSCASCPFVYLILGTVGVSSTCFKRFVCFLIGCFLFFFLNKFWTQVLCQNIFYQVWPAISFSWQYLLKGRRLGFWQTPIYYFSSFLTDAFAT